MFGLLPGYLDLAAQQALVIEVLEALVAAPAYTPQVPGGRPMSVRMSNLGPLGWISDERGYRYEPLHPLTRKPWPPIPEALRALWSNLCGPVEADACLVNLYGEGARMGLHQDRDEADFSLPVLSVSLGDTAIFRLGGVRRSDPTRSVRLASGDVCVLRGEARLAFHGIDRIIPGSSTLLPGGGRMNLTMRRARPAQVLVPCATGS